MDKKKKSKSKGIFEGFGAKEAVIVGGVMLASYFGLQYLEGNGGEGGLEGVPERRAGGILGSTTAAAAAPGISVTTPGGFTGFPAQTDYSSLLGSFLTPPAYTPPAYTPQPTPVTEAPDRPAAKKVVQEVTTEYGISRIVESATGVREYVPPAGVTTYGGAQLPAHLRPRIEQGAYISTADLIARGAVKKTPAEQSAEASYQKSVSIAYGRSGGSSRSAPAPAKKKTQTPARKKAERSYAKSVSIAYGK